jgi:hypothetical protein
MSSVLLRYVLIHLWADALHYERSLQKYPVIVREHNYQIQSRLLELTVNDFELRKLLD